jgi:hypothetical protein
MTFAAHLDLTLGPMPEDHWRSSEHLDKNDTPESTGPAPQSAFSNLAESTTETR